MFKSILKIPFASVSEKLLCPVADQVQLTGAFLTGWSALSTSRASTVVFWLRYNRGNVLSWKSVVPITETLL